MNSQCNDCKKNDGIPEPYNRCRHGHHTHGYWANDGGGFIKKTIGYVINYCPDFIDKNECPECGLVGKCNCNNISK